MAEIFKAFGDSAKKGFKKVLGNKNKKTKTKTKKKRSCKK